MTITFLEGNSRQRMAELHLSEARRHALDLFSVCSSRYPNEWLKQIAERVIISSVDFASHAYRVNELCSVQASDIDGASQCRYRFSFAPPALEDNYKNALELVRHSVSLTLGWAAHDGERVFPASDEDNSPAYLTIETDWKRTGSVSVYGIAATFLTVVVPRVKAQHPKLEF